MMYIIKYDGGSWCSLGSFVGGDLEPLHLDKIYWGRGSIGGLSRTTADPTIRPTFMLGQN